MYPDVFELLTGAKPVNRTNYKNELDRQYDYLENPNNKIECYISSITNRYFTFTENKINDKEINERTEQLIKFLNLYMKKDNYKIQNKQTIYNIDNEDIINIIAKRGTC